MKMTIAVVLAMSLAAFGEFSPALRTETARLQGEIDRVSQSGGGRVVVAKGVSEKPICIRGNKTTLVRDMTLENIRATIKAAPPFDQCRTEGLKVSGLDILGDGASCDWRGAASFSAKERRVVSP